MKMKKEYIVSYTVESAAQWDGLEPHEEEDDYIYSDSIEDFFHETCR